MRHIVSHLQIFYAIIKVEYFTANRDLVEYPQYTQTLKGGNILKTIILSEIPVVKHVNT